MSSEITRTSIQLYRDCLRLAKHIGGSSAKGSAIKNQIRTEFRKAMHETDPEKIEHLKANAIRGLSNYLMFASAGKDARLKEAVGVDAGRNKLQEAEWSDVPNK